MAVTDRKAYNAAYYDKNKDRLRLQMKEYKKRTIEIRKAQRKAAYAANPEPAKKAAREWFLANPEKRLGQRLKRYGITPDDYRRMMDAQDGKCAICGRSEFGGKKTNARPHVDHCHKTGKVRGLLCVDCNHGIGKFKDNPVLVDRAAEYLRKYQEQ